MREREREQFAQLLASQQKYQMATLLLLEVCRRQGIDMDWVWKAEKQAVVEELLRIKANVPNG